MTTLRAQPESKFKLKYLIIGVLAAGYGLYCLYDAVIKYPALRPVSEAYYGLEEELNDDEEFQKQWKVQAAENGWKETAPYTAKELTTNTIYSYIVGVLFSVIGFPSLLTGLKCFGQWIEADEKSLTNSKGQTVAFDQIKSIDKSKWEKKGLARLIYDDGGTEKAFVLDDLKFERSVTDDIMLRVEQATGIDKIVGGLSEAEYREKSEQQRIEKEERRARLDAEEETE